jgi:hypothetical protein
MPNIKQFKTKEDYLNWYRKYREEKRDKLREYNRKYNKMWRRDFGFQNEKNSKERYPEKQYARGLLQRAVKNGKIKRQNCEVCNKPNAQGHHDDYYQPLKVKWFCQLHHTEYHRNLTKVK